MSLTNGQPVSKSLDARWVCPPFFYVLCTAKPGDDYSLLPGSSPVLQIHPWGVQVAIYFRQCSVYSWLGHQPCTAQGGGTLAISYFHRSSSPIKSGNQVCSKNSCHHDGEWCFFHLLLSVHCSNCGRKLFSYFAFMSQAQYIARSLEGTMPLANLGWFFTSPSHKWF